MNLPPCDRSTGGLESLVETGKVGKLAAVVGEGTHEPNLTLVVETQKSQAVTDQ